MPPAHLRIRPPSVSLRPAFVDAAADDALVASKRFSDQVFARLEPVERLLRQDPRLARAGAVVGLGAAALGALRGQQSLTFIGTQAVRLGLEKQLTQIRRRSGFVIEPSIEYRGIGLIISRTF